MSLFLKAEKDNTQWNYKYKALLIFDSVIVILDGKNLVKLVS